MTDNCTTRWILYTAWRLSAPDVRDQHKDEYSAHLSTCPTCRASLDAHASGQPNPVLSESEVNSA